MFQCVIALVRQLLELLKDSKRGYDEVVDFLGGCLKERRDEEELLASAERKSRKLKVLMCRVEEEKGRLMRLLVGCTERFGKLRDEYEVGLK